MSANVRLIVLIFNSYSFSKSQLGLLKQFKLFKNGYKKTQSDDRVELDLKWIYRPENRLCNMFCSSIGIPPNDFVYWSAKVVKNQYEVYEYDYLQLNHLICV